MSEPEVVSEQIREAAQKVLHNVADVSVELLSNVTTRLMAVSTHTGYYESTDIRHGGHIPLRTRSRPFLPKMYDTAFAGTLAAKRLVDIACNKKQGSRGGSSFRNCPRLLFAHS